MKNKLLFLATLPMALSMASCAKNNTVEFDYIFTAQPVVSATNSEVFKNVQDAFNEKSGGKLLTQASVFIRNGYDLNKATAFLLDLASDITTGIANPALIKTSIEAVGSVAEQQNKFGVPGAMAAKVTTANNGFSLGYNLAHSIKDDISSFVNLLTGNKFGVVPEEAYFVPSIDLAAIAAADFSDARILAPTGAPSIALYGHATEENFTTTTNPQEGLIPQFKTDNYDVIIAPTQGGLTQIVKQSAEYKIAATITYGNFYIISTGRDDDGIINKGDKVLIFQENDVPGKVFKYVYGDLELDITAVNAVSDTKAIIENNGVLVK